MINNPFINKKIILGVTGSIAAYKAVDLASQMSQAGASVHTVLSEAAQQFISPLCFQSVTANESYTDKDLWGNKAHIIHVNLASESDLLLIAPATANTIAKLTHGLADNLLTLVALSYHISPTSPFLIAPAMDAGMFQNEVTQKNIQLLEQRGITFIGPEEGHLASGLSAKGRMTQSTVIMQHISYVFSRMGGSLKGKKIVVTAAGTQEPIDPVRFIGNRSSGKQGYAIAQAALDAGADVTIISAAANISTPYGAEIIQINTAKDMEGAVIQACKNADALIMAAAVADFYPTNTSANKIKKKHQTTLIIELSKTPDILLSVKTYRTQHKFPKIVIGFAAETEDYIANAKTKLHEKGLDMIVANDVSAADAGFSVDNNRVSFISKDDIIISLPLMSKREVADHLIEKLIDFLNQK